MLGIDLCAVLQGAGWEVIAADLAEFDITDASATASFVAAHAPQVVINCAAYTAVDQAESEVEIAFRANRDGARSVAKAAAKAGAMLVQISTDYIFDGAKQGAYVEGDPPNPSTVYGRSKLAGEEAVRATLEEHCIVRTAWLYGPHGKSFPRTILESAAQGKALRVVNDQRGCPTYTVHLAEALTQMIARPSYGTYHAVNAGACTWYELACETLRRAGLAATVTPVSTAEFPRPAPRPTNSVLDTSKLRRDFGVELPPWQEGVAAFVARWQEARRAA
jgi:dTDP-4-dehydrorhamnose reductase